MRKRHTWCVCEEDEPQAGEMHNDGGWEGRTLALGWKVERCTGRWAGHVWQVGLRMQKGPRRVVGTVSRGRAGGR